MKCIYLVLFFSMCTHFCRAQTPDTCNLVKLTLENKDFLKLFKIDSTYKGPIVIVDNGRIFKKCLDTIAISERNKFIISDSIPGKGTPYYNCLGVIKDPDYKNQYFVFMVDYNSRFFVTVSYKPIANKWVFDHFDSGSTEFR